MVMTKVEIQNLTNAELAVAIAEAATAFNDAPLTVSGLDYMDLRAILGRLQHERDCRDIRRTDIVGILPLDEPRYV